MAPSGMSRSRPHASIKSAIATRAGSSCEARGRAVGHGRAMAMAVPAAVAAAAAVPWPWPPPFFFLVRKPALHRLGKISQRRARFLDVAFEHGDDRTVAPAPTDFQRAQTTSGRRGRLGRSRQIATSRAARLSKTIVPLIRRPHQRIDRHADPAAEFNADPLRWNVADRREIDFKAPDMDGLVSFHIRRQRQSAIEIAPRRIRNPVRKAAGSLTPAAAISSESRPSQAASCQPPNFAASSASPRRQIGDLVRLRPLTVFNEAADIRRMQSDGDRDGCAGSG